MDEFCKCQISQQHVQWCQVWQLLVHHLLILGHLVWWLLGFDEPVGGVQFAMTGLVVLGLATSSFMAVGFVTSGFVISGFAVVSLSASC